MFYVPRDSRASKRAVSLTLTLAAVLTASILGAIGITAASAAPGCTPGTLVPAGLNYAGNSYPRGWCDVNLYMRPVPGAHLIASPAVGAPVTDILRTPHAWFACGLQIGGRGWLLTRGDDFKVWGWIDATSWVTQTGGGSVTHGVWDCDTRPGPNGPIAPSGPIQTASFTGTGSGATAVRTGLAHVGNAYVYGANGPTAWDCSSFTQMAWKSAGVSIPRTAAMQSNAIKKVSKNELQPGDLLFYYAPIGHVAMYTGNGKVVEASTPQQGVSTRNVYWTGFAGAGRPG